MRTIEIENLQNPTCRKIVRLLAQKDQSLFGDIVMDLSLSVNKAQEAVQILLDKGIIAYRKHSKYLQLIVHVK